MNNLASIIQLISSAVSAKMTMKLSERINQLTTRTGPDTGWVDRTRAGRAIQDRKISSSFKAVDNARSANEIAAINRAKAENELLQEQAHSTGRSLADLSAAADDAKKKFEQTSEALARATSNYDKVRASALSKTDMNRLQKSARSVESASERKASLRGKLGHVQSAIDSERANPTGMSPEAMSLLEGSAEYLKMQFESASESLSKLTDEQDKLRASIDSQLRFRDNMSKDDFESTSESSRNVQSATDVRDAIRKHLEDLQDEVGQKTFAPGGISQKDADRIKSAGDSYRKELDKATAVLDKLTKIHEDEVQSAIRNSRATNAASDRQPSTMLGRAGRRLGVEFKKRIGSRGRKFLKGGRDLKKKIQKQLDRLDPKKVKKRIEDSKKAHEEAESNYKKNPTPENKEILDKKKLLLGEAEGDAGLAEMAEGASVALGMVAAAVGAVTVACVGAYEFIQKSLAEGKKEVERFRHERSTFSGAIASAVLKYDAQSRNLEQRSSSATSGSAIGVVNSTMGLRESNQERSEIWEDLGNKVLATCLDIATGMSESVKVIEGQLVPIVQSGLENIREWLKSIGVPIKDIAKNTKKDLPVGLSSALRAFDANHGMIGNKKHTRDIPGVK